MKQTITIRRTETRVIQLEVPQPLQRQVLTDLANEELQGLHPENFGKIIGHQTSDWSVTKLSPECECAPQAQKKHKR